MSFLKPKPTHPPNPLPAALGLLLCSGLACACVQLWAIQQWQSFPPMPFAALESPRAASVQKQAAMCRVAAAIDAIPVQRNISIALASDQFHTWTSAQTVAASNGTIWTVEGRFADVTVTNRVRVQIIELTATNGLWASHDFTNWTMLKPPGDAYSPNVIYVGAPGGNRFFKTDH